MFVCKNRYETNLFLEAESAAVIVAVTPQQALGKALARGVRADSTNCPPKKKSQSEDWDFICIKRFLNYAFGSIDTKDLSFAFFLKTTFPSTKACKVWSFPIPTFNPGW